MLTTEATVITMINMKFSSELPGNQDKKGGCPGSHNFHLIKYASSFLGVDC